ncbi:MAG: PHP domain-containing protein [Coprothermobacterota bacterium]|nr:PHP domain-containing protein [Coprothermobacterota bacterium]
MKVDLHTHSTASDGCLNPAELVRHACREGLALLSLTDHDTAVGLAEAEQASRSTPLRFVPGIEFSTEVEQAEVHILGYWLDFDSRLLKDFLERLGQSRRERIRRMVGELQKLGMHLQADEILESKLSGVFGRPHVALALVQHGYASNVEDAFARYLKIGKPAYVPHRKLSPWQVVSLAVKVGGLAVMAHPGLSARDDLIPSLVREGLGGLEVYYPEHNPSQVHRYLDLAREADILITGGSDFHGPAVHHHPTGGNLRERGSLPAPGRASHSPLGSANLPAEDVERFLAWGRAHK